MRPIAERRRAAYRGGVATSGQQSGLTASWLGSRLGIGPTRVDILRRSGELIGIRAPGSQEYRYPSWQFTTGWKVKPIVPKMVAVARERGLSDDRLGEVLDMRVGMGGRRVADLAREGDEEGVVRAIRSAATARGS